MNFQLQVNNKMNSIIKNNCLDYKQESQDRQIIEDKVNSNLKIYSNNLQN